MRRLLVLLPLFSACAVAPEAGPKAELGSQDSSLVGGRPATASEFPATVNMGGCTGAKVGPRHFLLAAHCVHDGYENKLWSQFEPGGEVWVSPDESMANPTFRPLPVVATHVPSSWFETCVTPCPVNVLNPSHPPDLALVVVGADSPDIAEANVDLAPVQVGDPLVVAGYGCELGVGQPFGHDYARLKLQQLRAAPASALLHSGTYVAASDEGNVVASYVITPGYANDSTAASLCPGDSGGPLYRDDAGQTTLVGVNAYYTFQDGTGVSVTNWHTRLDGASRFGIGAWLEARGVNVVGQGSGDGDVGDGDVGDGSGDGAVGDGDVGDGDVGCDPACDGRACGSDGCGGLCGSCEAGETCNGAGQCEGPVAGCAGVPEWDESRSFYSIGERNARSGRVYECTNNGHCHRDPAGPFGHYGWTDRGPC